MKRVWRIQHGCGTELFSGDEDSLKRRCSQLALSQDRGATVTVEEIVGRAAQAAASSWRRPGGHRG
jgi:hypothetical protein